MWFACTAVDRIFLAGYSLGGNVALHAAALDARVAGVAAFSAFTPFRTDSNDRPTLGLRRLCVTFCDFVSQATPQN